MKSGPAAESGGKNDVTRVFSDIHLGHVASHVRAAKNLRPLFEGCARAVFNGDTWQERWKAGREEGRRELEAMKKMLADMDVEAVFLPGNHDPATGDAAGFLTLGSCGQILVTHGDGVFPEASPFSREMWRYGKDVRALIARSPEADRHLPARLERAREIGRILQPKPLPRLPVPLNFFVTALWPPSRPFQILRAWSEVGPAGFRFLEKFAPECRILLCGHFHRRGIWQKNGRVVVNTGAFVRGCGPQIAELRGEELRVRKVRALDGVFYPGKTLAVWKT